MKSYHRTLDASPAQVQAAAPVRKPVLRSSAVFPVICRDGISTMVTFMGYWLVKRSIAEVTLSVTLRDASGHTLKKQTVPVRSPKVVNFDPLSLIDGEKPADFLGSIEFEIFSERDLVVPYPAMVLCLKGEGFITAVHTTGRIYNDADDMSENNETVVPESGFDIHGEGYTPFIAFTNGPLAQQDVSLDYSIVSAPGESRRGSLGLGSLAAYETRVVELARQIPLDSFLGKEAGTIKISHPFRGFFPRFICGNFDKRAGTASITHTYYDCSRSSAPHDYWPVEDAASHGASILIPLLCDAETYTRLIFYPIYSPSRFSLSLDFHDESGRLLRRLTDFRTFDARATVFEAVDFRFVLGGEGLLGKATAANLVFDALRGEPFPARIKMGLNVGKDRETKPLPCNICFAPVAGTPDLGKPRAFRWQPLLNAGESIAVITNSCSLKDYSREARVRIRFFRSQDERVLEREVVIAPRGSLRVSVKRDDALDAFFGGQPGWITFESENPFIYGWYFDIHPSTGLVAGDHCF